MDANANPIQVMLIEDQPILSAALCQLLKSQGNIEIVGEAANSHDALALAERAQPDIILLDLLVDAHILDFIPALLDTAPDARAIVLTARPELSLHRRAIAQGALGLVLREQSTDILLRAIEQVHGGGVWMTGDLLKSVLHELSQNRQEMGRTKDDVSLIAAITKREAEVIVLIGEGLSNKQIAVRLGLSERTVHRHLSSIFEKLDVSDRLELTIFGYRTGLLKPA